MENLTVYSTNGNLVLNSKPVVEFKTALEITEQGECIKEWESSKHAGEALNIAPDLIRAAARGVQKTAGGFIWEYKEN